MKTCTRCRRELDPAEFYVRKAKKGQKRNERCKACIKELNRAYYLANLEKVKAQVEAYRQSRKHTAEFKAKQKAASSATHKKWKTIALEKIGKVCACCGESRFEFLSIDHVNNDGYKHRKETSSRNLYYMLSRPDYKSEYALQTLCFNCNFAKRYNGGICPHQERSETIPQGSTVKRPEAPDPLNGVKI